MKKKHISRWQQFNHYAEAMKRRSDLTPAQIKRAICHYKIFTPDFSRMKGGEKNASH